MLSPAMFHTCYLCMFIFADCNAVAQITTTEKSVLLLGSNEYCDASWYIVI